MKTPKLTITQPAMTEIKQSTMKRVILKVNTKLPRLSRSSSSFTARKSPFLSNPVNSFDDIDTDHSSIVQEKLSNKENLVEAHNQLEHLETSTDNDIKDEYTADNNDNQEAPVLMRNIAKTMSTSTTKMQKTNVIAAAARSLPKNFMRSLRGDASKKENNNPPINTLITTPSLSPPVVSQFSYTSSTTVIERKKKNRRSRSESISMTAQALSNMLKRRSKHRSGSSDSILKRNDNNSGTPALTYESFPDPDPDDFFNVYSWDIPDSIVSMEDAGGVLQMIEYDGIFINGVKVD
ncbi:7933_t:CDS:1 [Funneliformis geosporum]|uniref:935_t:CDS:1 n=1 Tax=Funneliformis geosporum TaxID=1117311 RepID=A0A9W4SJD8_9GLOM|nr:7933_t:CDS:1 [Funneliformis geosporum]CAI2170725.1 935_t:CDS:1 [Funneliformis geosporum]